VKSNVYNLLAERYIKPSHPKHSINPTDLALAYEKRESTSTESHATQSNFYSYRTKELIFFFLLEELIAELPGVPNPKDIKAVKEKVMDRMATDEDEGFQEMCSFGQVSYNH
jgi:hypothetical protein